MVWPEARARSTRDRLAASAARAPGSNANAARRVACRVDHGGDGERVAVEQQGVGRHLPKLPEQPGPHKPVLVRDRHPGRAGGAHTAAHHELRIPRIGLVRPVEDQEVLADVGDADRAVPGEAVAAAHLEHVSPADERVDRQRAVAPGPAPSRCRSGRRPGRCRRTRRRCRRAPGVNRKPPRPFRSTTKSMSGALPGPTSPSSRGLHELVDVQVLPEPEAALAGVTSRA